VYYSGNVLEDTRQTVDRLLNTKYCIRFVQNLPIVRVVQLITNIEQIKDQIYIILLVETHTRWFYNTIAIRYLEINGPSQITFFILCDKRIKQ